MFSRFKKKVPKKPQEDPFRGVRRMVKPDPDIQWYCPCCDKEATALLNGWVQCPDTTCGNQGGLHEKGIKRALKSVTVYRCCFCHTKVDGNKVRANMILCPKCNTYSDVEVATEKVAFNINK